MIRPPVNNIRILKSWVDNPRAWLDQLAAPGALDRAIVHKDAGRSSVLELDLTHPEWQREVAVIVKTVETSRIRDVFSRMLGRTRLMREVAGNELLRENNFRCPDLVALVRGSSTSGAHTEALILKKIDGPTLLEEIARDSLPVRRQHEVAGSVGDLAANLAMSGVFHRDFKASNIVLEHGSSVLPSLIDTAGVQSCDPSDGTEMLAKAYIEALGVGHPPRASLCCRAIQHHKNVCWPYDDWKADWRAAQRIILSHGDPTPKHNPLASLKPKNHAT